MTTTIPAKRVGTARIPSGLLISVRPACNLPPPRGFAEPRYAETIEFDIESIRCLAARCRCRDLPFRRARQPSGASAGGMGEEI